MISHYTTNDFTSAFSEGEYPHKFLVSETKISIDEMNEVIQLSSNKYLDEFAKQAKHHFQKAIDKNSPKEVIKGSYKFELLTKKLYEPDWTSL